MITEAALEVLWPRRVWATLDALTADKGIPGWTFVEQMPRHDVLASDEHVVGLVEASAEKDGVVVELPRVHVWHVRDGKLSELFLHPSDQHEFDAYWG